MVTVHGPQVVSSSHYLSTPRVREQQGTPMTVGREVGDSVLFIPEDPHPPAPPCEECWPWCEACNGLVIRILTEDFPYQSGCDPGLSCQLSASDRAAQPLPGPLVLEQGMGILGGWHVARVIGQATSTSFVDLYTRHCWTLGFSSV